MSNYRSIINDIRSGKVAPIYLLAGNEPWFIDQIVHAAEHFILPEEEKAFNQVVLYGNDVDTDIIMSEARQFAMMSERRVVIVKEAQQMQKSIDHLLPYMENPLPSTVLVIAMKGKSIRKDSKLAKAANGNGGVFFKSDKIKDNEVAQWVKEMASFIHFKINDDAAQLIADHVGNDPARIQKEFEKLEGLLPNGSVITADIVDKYIGISKEFNVFELTKAIYMGDKRKAYMIADYFAHKQKSHPIQLLLPSMYPNFVKLLKLSRLKNPTSAEVSKVLKVSPYFTQEYLVAYKHFNTKRVMHCIKLMREYDVRSKGVENASTSTG